MALQHDSQDYSLWVGTKPLPDEHKVRIDRWRQLHPDWEIRCWGNDDVDRKSTYVTQAFAAKAWNRVSDYCRMDALMRYGGIYMDVDVDVIKPLDPLLDAQAFVGFQKGEEMPHEMVNGAVFGSVAGHWLPAHIRDYLEQNMNGGEDTGAFTGPGLMTQTLMENGLEGYSDTPVRVRDVMIYPRRYFYPYDWMEAFTPDHVGPDTYAVHHWDESWVLKPSEVQKLWCQVKSKLKGTAFRIFQCSAFSFEVPLVFDAF